MDAGLDKLFENLPDPPATDKNQPVYVVAPLLPDSRYFVGKDTEGRACILIETDKGDRRSHAPIRLESLDVQFQLKALLRAGDKVTKGVFTVIRCRAVEADIIHYFLSIGETILHLLGDRPTSTAIASIVNRLALIFQRLQNPPSRPVNGLFGELFLIRHSRSPLASLNAWRIEDTARFDFSAGDFRLEVKTAAGRVRAHSFSYEQCNPPAGTMALAASLFVERSSSGVSLRELISKIEQLAASSSDLVMKLHSVVAATLGRTMPEALAIRFDERLATSSLQFYDLRTVPAIRDDPPAGVSDIHFRSDLSGSPQIPVGKLAQQEPALAGFLPVAVTR